jgi:hypothetical protein
VSSKRKKEPKNNGLEKIIRRGLCENVNKLRECLTKYETKVTGFSTQDGLLMRYDDTDAGFALYSWLLEIGFTAPVNSDHPVLQLPSNKVRGTIVIHPYINYYYSFIIICNYY